MAGVSRNLLEGSRAVPSSHHRSHQAIWVASIFTTLDGGDCCEATCEDWTFDCGEDGFDCRSDGSNLNILVERCTTYLTNFLGGNLALLNSVGDGVCNNELNVIECAFDNKDCCRSTCTTPQGQICSDTQFYNCTDTTLVCLTPIGDGEYKTILLFESSTVGKVLTF